MIQRYSSFFI